MPERDVPRQMDADGPSVEVLARYMAGECAPSEVESVRDWLGRNPDQARSVQALESAVATLGRATPPVDVEAALARVHVGMAVDNSVRSLRQARWSLYVGLASAAAVVLMALGRIWGTPGRLLLDRITHPGGSLIEAVTGAGERKSVRLADGTAVLLGPASALDYDSGFGHGRRTVTLRGMAEFDVHHDDDVPFVVMVGSTRIQDVGTRFVVRGDSTLGVIVAVTAGSVKLSSTNGRGSDIQLHAGQRAASSDSAGAQLLPGAVAFADTAWTLSDLAFVNTPFSQVAEALSLKFGVVFHGVDSTLAHRHFTGTFDQNDSLDRVLSTLGLALGTRLTLNGSTVNVSPDAAR